MLFRSSLVTAVSEIPWNGPIGGVQVGLVDGEIVLNPTQEQRRKSDLALTVAATMDKIVMIEAGANEVDEDTMLDAIKAAHVEIKKVIGFINSIVAERGKPKIDFQVVGLDMDMFHAIKEKYLDDFKAAMDTDDKNVRDAALLPIMDIKRPLYFLLLCTGVNTVLDLLCVAVLRLEVAGAAIATSLSQLICAAFVLRSLMRRQDEARLEPVSYTHLDVYKRQASATPARIGSRSLQVP